MNQARLSAFLGVDDAAFNETLNRAGRNFERFGQDLKTKGERAAKEAFAGFKRLSPSDLGMIGGTLTMGLTAPILAVGAAALKSATDMDSLRRGLTAITGSTAETERQLVRLREVAKLPGLGFKEAIQGSINLQSAGLSAAQSERAMRAFGQSIADAGKGKRELELVNLALSQIASSSKVLGQDVRQLQTQLPRMLQAMKAAFGTADTQELEKMGVKPAEFLTRITRELEKIRHTTGGAKNSFENFADSAGQALDKFGRPVLGLTAALADKLAPAMEATANAFIRLPGPVQNVALATAGVALVAGPALTVIGRLRDIAGITQKAFVGETVALNENSAALQRNTTAATNAAAAQKQLGTTAAQAAAAAAAANAPKLGAYAPYAAAQAAAAQQAATPAATGLFAGLLARLKGSRIGGAATKAGALFGKLGKFGGPAALLALMAGEMGLGMLPDEGGVGTFKGTAQGALSGAGMGGFLGSFFGPVGTVIGAGGGALFGGLGGLYDRQVGGLNRAAEERDEWRKMLDGMHPGQAAIAELKEQQRQVREQRRQLLARYAASPLAIRNRDRAKILGQVGGLDEQLRGLKGRMDNIRSSGGESDLPPFKPTVDPKDAAELQESRFTAQKERVAASLILAPEGQQAQREARGLVPILKQQRAVFLAEAAKFKEDDKEHWNLTRDAYRLEAEIGRLELAAAKERKENVHRGFELQRAALDVRAEAASALAHGAPKEERARAELRTMLPILQQNAASLLAEARMFSPKQTEYWSALRDYYQVQGQIGELRERAQDEEKAGFDRQRTIQREMFAAEVAQAQARATAFGEDEQAQAANDEVVPVLARRQQDLARQAEALRPILRTSLDAQEKYARLKAEDAELQKQIEELEHASAKAETARLKKAAEERRKVLDARLDLRQAELKANPFLSSEERKKGLLPALMEKFRGLARPQEGETELERLGREKDLAETQAAILDAEGLNPKELRLLGDGRLRPFNRRQARIKLAELESIRRRESQLPVAEARDLAQAQAGPQSQIVQLVLPPARNAQEQMQNIQQALWQLLRETNSLPTFSGAG